MKKKRFLALLLAGAVSCTFPISVSAEWKQDANKNWSWVENGTNQTGWKSIGNKWYYFDQNGIMKTGWIWDGNNWYYMEPSGAMKTGWLKDDGKWYYLKPSGEMAKGWQVINNKDYYLYDDGSMAADTMVDGFIIDQNGATDLGNEDKWNPPIGMLYCNWDFKNDTITAEMSFWNNRDKPITRVEFHAVALDKDGEILYYQTDSGEETAIFGFAGNSKEGVYPTQVTSFPGNFKGKLTGTPACLAAYRIVVTYMDGTTESIRAPWFFKDSTYNGPAPYTLFDEHPDYSRSTSK